MFFFIYLFVFGKVIYFLATLEFILKFLEAWCLEMGFLIEFFHLLLLFQILISLIKVKNLLQRSQITGRELFILISSLVRV